MRGAGRATRLTFALAAALAALLIGLTLTCLSLLTAIGTGAPRALAAAQDTPTALPGTATPQPTQAGQTTLTLLSPSSGQGPVGANLTFAGSRWSGSQVSIAAGASGCASPDATLGHAPISHGSFTVTLVWPTSLANPGTAYQLCATSDTGAAVGSGATYRVRSASPPALTLSLSQVGVGQEVQVQGSNFVGVSQVSLEAQTPRGTRALPTISPDPKDGSFVATYTPSSADMGSVTLTAASAPESSAPPALQASALLAVGPPLAATPTVAPTVAATDGPGVITTPNAGTTDIVAPTVLLGVGALLSLLALAGFIAWLLLRRRPSRRPPPGPPPLAPPGPRSGLGQEARGETARVPVAAGARASGFGERAPAADLPDASTPPAEWRRRPMSGKLWDYADNAPEGGYQGPYGGAHPASPRSASRRPRSGESTRYSPGALGGESQPTAPASGGYFGLPSLDNPDSAVTQPGGPAIPEAHE